jgi:glucokinase
MKDVGGTINTGAIISRARQNVKSHFFEGAETFMAKWGMIMDTKEEVKDQLTNERVVSVVTRGYGKAVELTNSDWVKAIAEEYIRC